MTNKMHIVQNNRDTRPWAPLSTMSSLTVLLEIAEGVVVAPETIVVRLMVVMRACVVLVVVMRVLVVVVNTAGCTDNSLTARGPVTDILLPRNLEVASIIDSAKASAFRAVQRVLTLDPTGTIIRPLTVAWDPNVIFTSLPRLNGDEVIFLT